MISQWQQLELSLAASAITPKTTRQEAPGSTIIARDSLTYARKDAGFLETPPGLPPPTDHARVNNRNGNRRPRRAPPKLPTELTDAELLTAVLGSASAPLCERLTLSHESFRELATATPAEIAAHGFTTGATNRLFAVFEIAKRYGEREWKIGEPFRGSGDIYAHFRERLAAETREHFYAVLLDNKHRKIRDVLLSLGSLTASIVHPRDCFHQIVRHSAAAVIFCHNHPAGDPTPSKEDIEITRRLREVGDLMGVRVLDHVVIGKGRYVSFVDDGYW